MRQETQTINIYQFDELPESTQEKIISEWRYNDHFFWSNEWQESLNHFEALFPIIVRNWEINNYNSWIYFDMTEGDCIQDLKGVRLFKYLLNKGYMPLDNCPFTGFCGDESLLYPLREFMKKPSPHMTFEQLMNDCLQEWVSDYQKDYEYWLSADCIREEIEANDYEFTENGKIH